MFSQPLAQTSAMIKVLTRILKTSKELGLSYLIKQEHIFPRQSIHTINLSRGLCFRTRKHSRCLQGVHFQPYNSSRYSRMKSLQTSYTNKLLTSSTTRVLQTAFFHDGRPNCQHHIQNNKTSGDDPSCSKQRVEFDDQPSSWLFVSPAAAGAYGAQVNVDLELDDLLSENNLDHLKANIKTRGMDLELARLLTNFEKLKRIQNEKAVLLSRRDDFLQKFRELKDMGNTPDVEKMRENLGRQMKSLKAEIAVLKSSWDLEEEIMLEALSLPNELHTSTPHTTPNIFQEANETNVPARTPSHVEIAQRFDLIKFSNVGPKAYYLKGDLAMAEMSLTSVVCDYLTDKGFRHVSGPEFVKTPIIEGCGLDVRDGNEVLTMIDPHKTVIEPMNHITGVSLPVFAAYVAKTCIGDGILPLKMFACGRTYQKSHLHGLFGATQTTQAALFSCTKEVDLDLQYKTCIDAVWNLLEQFGFHLRLSQASAMDLGREERRRVDFDVFSPSLEQFITVAKVSDVGDYVSRRLMVTHNQNHADIRSAQRLHMVHGTALDITSLLALWMEHSYSDQNEIFSLKKLPLVNSPSKSSS